jgi:hypothetical protein
MTWHRLHCIPCTSLYTSTKLVFSFSFLNDDLRWSLNYALICGWCLTTQNFLLHRFSVRSLELGCESLVCWQIYVRQCQPILSLVVQQCLPLTIKIQPNQKPRTSIAFWNKSYDLGTWALQFPCKIASRTPALEFVTNIVQINPLLSAS